MLIIVYVYGNYCICIQFVYTPFQIREKENIKDLFWHVRRRANPWGYLVNNTLWRSVELLIQIASLGQSMLITCCTKFISVPCEDLSAVSLRYHAPDLGHRPRVNVSPDHFKKKQCMESVLPVYVKHFKNGPKKTLLFKRVSHARQWNSWSKRIVKNKANVKANSQGLSLPGSRWSDIIGSSAT